MHSPSRSKYQAYQRRWRYYKVIQMVEKLLLLGITMYTPAASSRWLRLFGATIIATVSFVIAVATQPFNDVLEVTLDATSRYLHRRCHLLNIVLFSRSLTPNDWALLLTTSTRCANLANAATALAMDVTASMPSLVIDIVLIATNGVNACAFCCVVLGGPIR